MRGAENERVIVELFDTIDTVSKSNDENDTVIDKVKNNIVVYLSSYFDRQKKGGKKEQWLKDIKGI